MHFAYVYIENVTQGSAAHRAQLPPTPCRPTNYRTAIILIARHTGAELSSHFVIWSHDRLARTQDYGILLYMDST